MPPLVVTSSSSSVGLGVVLRGGTLGLMVEMGVLMGPSVDTGSTKSPSLTVADSDTFGMSEKSSSGDKVVEDSWTTLSSIAFSDTSSVGICLKMLTILGLVSSFSAPPRGSSLPVEGVVNLGAIENLLVFGVDVTNCSVKSLSVLLIVVGVVEEARGGVLVFLLNKALRRSLALALASDELGRNRDPDAEAVDDGLDVDDDSRNELFLNAASLSLVLLDPLDKSKLPEVEETDTGLVVVADEAVVVASPSSSL